MKVEVKPDQGEIFKPVCIMIHIKTVEEYRQMRRLALLNITIPWAAAKASPTISGAPDNKLRGFTKNLLSGLFTALRRNY